MLLITVNSWTGPSRKLSPEEANELQGLESERLVGYCTHLDLVRALEVMKEYEREFNRRSKALGITLSVVAISPIADISEELIANSRMLLLDTLKVDF